MPKGPGPERKSNGKWCEGAFPMPKGPEPERKGNGKWYEGRFRCRKGQNQREKATENGVYEHFRCRKSQNQYLWKKLCNSAMQTVTTGTKKCEESVKKCGQ